jgi:hypothetical protein
MSEKWEVGKWEVGVRVMSVEIENFEFREKSRLKFLGGIRNLHITSPVGPVPKAKRIGRRHIGSPG